MADENMADVHEEVAEVVEVEAEVCENFFREASPGLHVFMPLLQIFSETYCTIRATL